MPALPRLVSFLSAVIILFSLFTLTLTANIYAAPAPPNPQPCEDPLTGKLTDNWITNENGDAPIIRQIFKQGELGETVTVSIQETFRVDFSKLQALFGNTNSNYLEGRFQNENHRLENITALSGANFNLFHGPGQKAAPKVMADQLKVKYVDYVYNKPTLAESANKYTDINGQDPKIIYELVNIYQLPDLNPDTANPTPPSWGGDPDTWNQTWGRYWEKIPTAYSEFYEGELQFRIADGDQTLKLVNEGKGCPSPIRIIKFVMPEFWRTTSISNQLNQMVVPCAAQSFRHGANEDQCGGPKTITENKTGGLVSGIIGFCKQLIENTPKKLMRELKNIIQISANFINPVKEALAQTPQLSPSPDTCIKKLGLKDKESTAPYCALPPDQLLSGDSCINQNDENKLDKENPNVVCTFLITWSKNYTIRIVDPDPEKRQPDDFDSCTDEDGDGIYNCYVTIRIWPVFRIPWLVEIWNNTLYSDETEGKLNKGLESKQETGRPGIYSVFTPQAVSLINSTASFDELFEKCKNNDQKACEELYKMTSVCGNIPKNPFDAFKCFKAFLPKNLPGKVQQTTTLQDPKERFIGSTDCGKEFVRDVALKPKALQEFLGIKNKCEAK